MTTYKKHLLAAASITAVMAAGAASAQTDVFGADDRAQDAVEDLEEDVAEDFERDIRPFGNAGRELGWYGSVSARATATSGNTDNADIGIGSRMGYFDGVNGHDVTLSYSYGEVDGVMNEESLLVGYDYTREFGTNTYFYAKAQLAEDRFGPYDTDAFIGAGLGYRIFNSPETQWSVAAGPGYRRLVDRAGFEVEEGAASLSSNYMTRITPDVFITNDTDILYSESDTAVNNEFGVNVAMSNTLALRTSLLTEYHTEPAAGFEDTDNTLGVSVVYTFD